VHLIEQQTDVTKNSDIAEGPRDTLCQLIYNVNCCTEVWKSHLKRLAVC